MYHLLVLTFVLGPVSEGACAYHFFHWRKTGNSKKQGLFRKHHHTTNPVPLCCLMSTGCVFVHLPVIPRKCQRKVMSQEKDVRSQVTCMKHSTRLCVTLSPVTQP